jgi:hypothetical protein
MTANVLKITEKFANDTIKFECNISYNDTKNRKGSRCQSCFLKFQFASTHMETQIPSGNFISEIAKYISTKTGIKISKTS